MDEWAWEQLRPGSSPLSAPGRTAVLRDQRADRGRAVVKRAGRTSSDALPPLPGCADASPRINFATPTPSRWREKASRSTSSSASSGTANLGVTSIYLQGIDNAEIIETVHTRHAPVIPAAAALAR